MQNSPIVQPLAIVPYVTQEQPLWQYASKADYERMRRNNAKNNGGIMDKKTENVKNEKVVFYAPLPVNKPYPIIRPSEKSNFNPR